MRGREMELRTPRKLQLNPIMSRFGALVCAALAMTASAFAPSVVSGAPRSTRGVVLRMSDPIEDLKASIMANDDVGFQGTEIGGIALAAGVPEGTVFEVPAKAKFGMPDGEYTMTCSPGESTAGGKTLDIEVVPDAMTMEDFYAGFDDAAPAWLTVENPIGKLERKGGEPSVVTIKATPPKGEAFDGEVFLVCVLPDDIDKVRVSRPRDPRASRHLSRSLIAHHRRSRLSRLSRLASGVQDQPQDGRRRADGRL